MSLFSVLTIVLGLASPAMFSTAQSAVPQEFVIRVNQYVDIQRFVTAPLGPLQMCSDPEQLVRQKRAFAAAIREARLGAREGNIFTPDVARYFRGLIARVATERGLDFAGELEDAAAWDTDAAFVEVNAQLPWSAGPRMWMAILWQLPELPLELEYRFVGRDLVLLDIAGTIVVDVLRDALPIYDGSEPS